MDRSKNPIGRGELSREIVCDDSDTCGDYNPVSCETHHRMDTETENEPLKVEFIAEMVYERV